MDFCDMNCRHAEWPENEALDGSASCRTFQAIYCGKKQKIVHKNGPCADKEKRPQAQADRGACKKIKRFLG
jgi:hypothetical protein